MPARLKSTVILVVLIGALSYWSAIGLGAVSVRIVDDVENCSSQLQVTRATSREVTLSVGIDALAINNVQMAQQTYSRLELPDGQGLTAGYLTDVGMPQMPSLSTFIGIPDMAGVSVDVTYDGYDVIDNIDVMPCQPPEPEGGFTGPVAFAKNMTAYHEDAFYPGTLAEVGEPVILRDVRMVRLSVYPVQYNPARRQLRIYRNVSVQLNYQGEVVNPLTNRRPYLSAAFLPLYRSILGNFDAYIASIGVNQVKRGGYLIIVPNQGSFMWKNYVEPLARWKRAKGYDVRVVTTNEITPSGYPTNTQIKTFLQNAYNTWETPPEFICIIGDEDLNSGGYLVPDYPYSSYPSDHQYACLAGTDWFADVGVARAAVDNLTELQAFVAKTLVYEKTPNIGDDPAYWQRGVSVSTDRHAISPVWTCLWVKDRLLQKGFTRVDTFFQRANYTPPASAIRTVINAGVGYVNYRGWAFASGWAEPPFYVSDLGSCTNTNKPGVMTSIVCGTGNFGSSTDPCFGEKYIRMGSQSAPTGGPAFFGSTDGSTHTQWNNPITIGFYRGLLEDDIYHFTLAALAGKMRQYTVYPRATSTIQQYHHTYNMLGDPELEMRLKQPRYLLVTFPATVPQGVSHVLFRVSDTGERPIEGAYVTVIKGDSISESYFAVGCTDANGDALVALPRSGLTGSFTVTVTGRDLHPYISTLNITEAGQAVVWEAHAIDDDTSGLSRGNGDSLANPAETIELSVMLRNSGSTVTAQNVTAVLSTCDSTKAKVYQANAPYSDIPAGQSTWGGRPFVVGISPDVTDGEIVTFRVNACAAGVPDGWSTYFGIPVVAPNLRTKRVVVSGNGRLDAGDTADLVVYLTNNGHKRAQGLSATLSTVDPYVRVIRAGASYGNIAVGDSAANNATPFTVVVDSGTFNGRNISFTLDLASSDGGRYKTTFNLTVGPALALTDPSGPDAYGYYVYDNTDAGYSERPTYEWFEIRTLGTNRNLGDDANCLVNLPFPFVYYGRTYNRITICSNGWICMDTTQWVAFRNWCFPDPSNARAMIAPFWDDLGPTAGNANNIYTYHDATGHRFIVEWYNVPARDYSASQTFQVILYDPAYYPTITGDGRIEFVYNNIVNGDAASGENYATVGFENFEENIGFNITYSNYYAAGAQQLAAGRVYRITTNTGRGGVSGTASATGGDNTNITVHASTGQMTITNPAGVYRLLQVPPGPVSLTFSKPGWFDQTLTGVMVNANEVTTGTDATLEMCPIPDSLIASDSLLDRVHLSWNAVSHAALQGYDIYRCRWRNGDYVKINDQLLTVTSYDDFGAVDSTVYWYYVVAVYGPDQKFKSLPSNIDAGFVEGTTGVDNNSLVPSSFVLAQNYPNPFNARTVINYALPTDCQVKLEVFNIMGQRVRTLFDGLQAAGSRSVVWDGCDDHGTQLASGLYFYRLTAPQIVLTKRMLLLR